MKGAGMYLNGSLLEMGIGIWIWGAGGELLTVWFVDDRLRCAVGLFLGCLLATAAAWHMWKTLDQALDMGEEAAKFVTVRSALRYGAFVLVFILLMVTDFANPLTAFLGLMGLKASAYLQPAIHKIMTKKG